MKCLAGLLCLSACISTAPLDGRPCPCAQGWFCCASTGTCLRENATCPAPAPDAGCAWSFAPAASYPTLPAPDQAAFAELDGDGNPDVVVVGGGGVDVFLGDGDGGLRRVQTLASGDGGYASFALADLDRTAFWTCS